MAADPRPRTVRVLYAEDSESDADLTRAYFENFASDFVLEIVGTGADCLARLQNGRYDALLLDHHLPDMDGADLLKELTAQRVSLPVVMVTGVGDEALVVRVLHLGACDYVPKHGNYVERLPNVLRKAIAEYGLLEERRHASGRQSRRILYVEHNPADVDLTLNHVSEVAPHIGIEVARSAAEALVRLHHETFDLVLTDLRMPDMNGLELLQEVKQLHAAVPFIVVTGKGDEEAAAAALKLGAYDYIVKRDDYLEHLPNAIDHAIGRAQLLEMNRQLRKHVDALADQARRTEEFLAMLGHELRNPLAPIRTALELLRGSRGHDAVVALHAHDVMDRQVTHMARLLDDLLDVARITSGRIKLNMQDVDLRDVIAEAIDSVGGLIDARRHRVTTVLTDAPLFVRGDMTRLVQVVVNLLNNAAKYTSEEGTIDISAVREDGSAVIGVADTGAGISASLLPRIFDLFTQEDRALDRAPGGLGLGLTLVRRITELHGGTVEAHSEGRGKGSTFVVRLPLRTPDTVTATEPTTAALPAVPLRCLVVEDNVDAARMLECALTLERHNVRLAFDGMDAVEAAADFRPDAIVLDIGLPRMNGYDAARAIRRLPGLADVRIIAVTGYGQESDREKSREAGIDGHLVKPIDLDQLLRALVSTSSASHG